MKISVAAVPYFWSKENYLSFYEALAKTPVDIIYLGETVCAKRRSMNLPDWLDIAAMLKQSGKEVVLSTLTLIEAESEVNYLAKIARQKNYLIEANDLSAIQIAHKNQNNFVAGSAINIYNNQTLKIFKPLGLSRWSIPVELGKLDLAPMIPMAKNLAIELEYQVFGRMPLAYSARCFTARHHQLEKDKCQFKCLENEQGILVKTQEGDSFAQINGIQTQSAKVINLLTQWQQLKSSGIDILRIMPVNPFDTIKLICQLKQIISGETTANNDIFKHKYEYCNGYWFQIEGMKFRQETSY